MRSTPRSPASQQVNPQLNGMAFTAYDRARAEARDPRGGYFAGVPTLVKDNVDVAGMPTMQGADSWVGHPAKKDGDFARMFLATGLIPLGKSQLSEYGYSAAAEHPRLGAVRTPWNPDHIAGASSAGSAALVAAGAVPIAHANDGGGLDPDPGLGQRAGRAQADPRPAGPGQA